GRSPRGGSGAAPGGPAGGTLRMGARPTGRLQSPRRRRGPAGAAADGRGEGGPLGGESGARGGQRHRNPSTREEGLVRPRRTAGENRSQVRQVHVVLNVVNRRW